MVSTTAFISDREAEVFKRKCVSEGASRVVLNKVSWCFTGYIEYEGEVYEVLLARGLVGNHYYAKYTYRPSEALSCEYILYNPYGYFVFSRDVEELAERLIEKIRLFGRPLPEDTIEL